MNAAALKALLISLLIMGAILPLMAQEELEMDMVDQFHYDYFCHIIGLCYDGTYLWMADTYSDSLTAINPDSGEEEYSIPSPTEFPIYNLAYDGGYLWASNLEYLYKISPEDGSLLTTFQIPNPTGSNGYIRGLDWYNGYLYCLLHSETVSIIAALDVENNVWVDTLAIAGSSFSSGLTFMNGYFWLQDSDEYVIRNVNAETGQCEGWFPHYYLCRSTVGITSDGEYMYCSDGFHNIYKYEIEGCNAVQENNIQLSDLPYQMKTYPNPFNPETRIEFEIMENAGVELTVYDLKGRLVKRLVNGKMSAGKHFVDWDGSNVSSGIYFCRLAVDGRVVASQRMLLLK